MTTTTTTTLDDMIRMRKAGHSYRDIGAKFGMSHEKARNVLTTSGVALPTNTHAYKREERQKEVKALADWLNEHGPVPRSLITEKFGYTSKEINLLVQDGAPGHLILATGRVMPDMPDEEVMESLRRAWRVFQKAAPDAVGLSHASYDLVRDPDRDLSAARITSRYGWVNACAKAGVPSGGRLRAASTYKHQFSSEQIMNAVSQYVDECREARKRPTYLGYDRWQRTRAGAPSGSLVRMRMDKLGYNTWPEIIAAALQPVGR